MIDTYTSPIALGDDPAVYNSDEARVTFARGDKGVLASGGNGVIAVANVFTTFTNMPSPGNPDRFIVSRCGIKPWLQFAVGCSAGRRWTSATPKSSTPTSIYMVRP